MRAILNPRRHLATALGLVLPLLALPPLVLPASADPRTWVDPPKSAPSDAAAPKAAVPSQAATPAADQPRKAAETAPPVTAPAEAAPRQRQARAAKRTEARERVAAAPRPHHRPYRSRLADTPAMGPTAAPVAAAPAPAGRVEAAQALAMDYLSVVSAPGEAMVGAAPRFYGTRIRFYGRNTSLAALVDEKRGFVHRWPERRYAARAFSTRCSPDGATCIVRAIVDFRAANPQRGAVSRGASELVLEVSFAGQRPVIVAESGRVLHRDGRGQERAETLAPGAGRG